MLGSALVPFTGGSVRAPVEYADRYPSLAAALEGAADLEAVDDAGSEQGLGELLRAEPGDEVGAGTAPAEAAHGQIGAVRTGVGGGTVGA